MQRLNRVADPSSLDALEGARARLGVDVPGAWLDEGGDLAILSPRRLTCARCDGGGCDGCARSGVLRAPEDREARVVVTRLPAIARAEGSGVAIRIPAPFGPDHEIVLLVIELREAPEASDRVRRVPLPPPEPEAPLAPIPSPWAVSPYAVTVALAALAAIIAAAMNR